MLNRRNLCADVRAEKAHSYIAQKCRVGEIGNIKTRA
jgi:hypothetical protein